MPSLRDFLMPDLGEGLTEGEINRWLVAVGDMVTVDQPIAEISTEKAIVEVPTPFAGRVATLHGVEGETHRGRHPADQHRGRRRDVGVAVRQRARRLRHQ